MKQNFTKSLENLSVVIVITLLSFATSSILAQSKQVIGSFPTMDGGFEGQAASGTITAATYATGNQGTVWTGSSAMATFQSATPRTGGKYVNINFTSTTKRFQSPTAPAGAILNNVLTTTGTTTSASMDITAVASTTNAVVGMGIAGTGIPSGATITAINSNTISISSAATSSGTAVAIVVYPNVTYTMQYYYRTTGTTNVGGAAQYIGASADGTNPLPTMVYTVLGNIGKGTTAVGSNIITAYAASSPTAITLNGPIGGAGIPAGTTVTAFDATTITISQNATAAASNVILSTLPLAGTNNSWVKISSSITPSPSTNASPQYGYACFVRTAAAMAVAMDFDDAVMYAGNLDETAPDPVTTPTAPTSSSSQMVVSWTAPSTGVDGGGYMVVRAATDPTAVPNVNGIYAVGNTVSDGVGTSGTVVYLGTNPTFTDLTLTASTKYYYRIYTVDKAFNYSAATSVNGTTDVGTSLTQTKILGVSFDGQTIHNASNVGLQVFDIAGRKVVSSSKDINMASNTKGVYLVKSNNGMLKIILAK